MQKRSLTNDFHVPPVHALRLNFYRPLECRIVSLLFLCISRASLLLDMQVWSYTASKRTISCDKLTRGTITALGTAHKFASGKQNRLAARKLVATVLFALNLKHTATLLPVLGKLVHVQDSSLTRNV